MKKSDKYLIGTGLAAIAAGFVWSLVHTRKKEEQVAVAIAHTKEHGSIRVRLATTFDKDHCQVSWLTPVDKNSFPAKKIHPEDLSHGLKQWRTLMKQLLELDRLTIKRGMNLR